MRVLLALLSLSLAGCIGPRVQGREVEFKRVWPGWRDAESFERISEYFGGTEDPKREVIVRTQAAERRGFYFLVRVKSGQAHPGAHFELQVIHPAAPEPRVHRFPVSVPARESVYQLGITGADWPGGKGTNPVAWKLALVSAEGRVLEQHHSFLWEKPRPAKPAAVAP